MAETLLALLLVSSSAKGSQLVFRWPPDPTPFPRISRPEPDDPARAELDNIAKSSYTQAEAAKAQPHTQEGDYHWRRPQHGRERSLSYSAPPLPLHAPSRNASMSTTGDNPFYNNRSTSPELRIHDYENALGYSAEFLAGILSPHQASCFQRFELVIDDLAFIGHPVCVNAQGKWKPSDLAHGSGSTALAGASVSAPGLARGRNKHAPQPEAEASSDTDVPVDRERERERDLSQWLQTFHFVVVLDPPDPSSSHAGNVSRYYDVIYEQLAFVMAAVLYREQVSANWVEMQCEMLSRLKESCFTKDEPFASFITQALTLSPLASSVRSIYEAIKTSQIAYITIHNLPLEIQLPPYLDALLHVQDSADPESGYGQSMMDEDAMRTWRPGPDLPSFGWRLAALEPWKSVLLLDDYTTITAGAAGLGFGFDSTSGTERPNLADSLLKFLSTCSITLNLADLASLLDWDLEKEVYPVVRFLVVHRRAKLVDRVHSGLKTVFSLPRSFPLPIKALEREFAEHFKNHMSNLPTLPKLLALISSSVSYANLQQQQEQQANATPNATPSSGSGSSHFFATVVKSKSLIPLYIEVINWMLEHDMLVTMHLRVRVVATKELKARVRMSMSRRIPTRRLSNNDSRRGYSFGSGSGAGGWDSQRQGGISASFNASRFHFPRDYPEDELDMEDEEDEEDEDSDDHSDTDDDHDDHDPEGLLSTMIDDPARATSLQRKWLTAMSVGKDPKVARRFELINQYFDGRKTDDEILYRADISRKQLREVLHHYDEYVQIFLHP